MIITAKKSPSESAKDYVVRQLIYNIIHFNLIPGQQLDTAQLCELFHVSKIPLREAELELAQTRLLEIRPKVGVFVTCIDTDFIEEIRSLRSTLESELATNACDLFTREQIDSMWENIALWKMYLERNNEEKVFQLDKEFHKMLYMFCYHPNWYQLVDNISPHYDRTIVLSFRCHEMNRIVTDHEELVRAIEAHDKEKAAHIARLHMTRYIENLDILKQQFADYFVK